MKDTVKKVAKKVTKAVAKKETVLDNSPAGKKARMAAKFEVK